MAGKKTGKRILTALIVILVLILSLGLLSRLLGGIVGGSGITLTYAGESYKSSVSGLEIAAESEFGVKLRDKSASYDVKIYALGTEENDFAFTVGGSERRARRGVHGRLRGRENGRGLHDLLRRGKSAAGHLGGRGDRAAGGDPRGGQIPAGNTKRKEYADG